jgi:hypothetical protein
VCLLQARRGADCGARLPAMDAALPRHPGRRQRHTHAVTIRAGDPEPEEHSRPGKAATLTVRSVCAQCNNGWMGRLEDQARPYLLTMIRGNGRTYHATGRTLIATWFVKTALVAGSKFSPPLPHAFYEQVRATGRPSDNTRVWLAATPWNEMHYTDSARSRCTTRRNRRPTSRTPSAP